MYWEGLLQHLFVGKNGVVTPPPPQKKKMAKEWHTNVRKRIRIWKHSFEINFFFTIRTGLFLTNNTPTTNTEFVKSDHIVKVM